MFYWKFYPSSKATIIDPPQPIALTIEIPDQEIQTLKQLQPNKVYSSQQMETTKQNSTFSSNKMTNMSNYYNNVRSYDARPA